MLKNTAAHYIKNFIIGLFLYSIYGLIFLAIFSQIRKANLLNIDHFVIGSSGIIIYTLIDTFSHNKYIEKSIQVTSKGLVDLTKILNKHLKSDISLIENGIYDLKPFKYAYHIKLQVSMIDGLVILVGPRRLICRVLCEIGAEEEL